MRIIISIGDGIENFDDGILDIPYEHYTLRVIGRGIRFVSMGEKSEFNSYIITFWNSTEAYNEIKEAYRNGCTYVELEGEKIL